MTTATEPTRPSEYADAGAWAYYHAEMAEATLEALRGRDLPPDLASAALALAQVHAQLAIAYEMREARPTR